MSAVRVTVDNYTPRYISMSRVLILIIVDHYYWIPCFTWFLGFSLNSKFRRNFNAKPHQLLKFASNNSLHMAFWQNYSSPRKPDLFGKPKSWKFWIDWTEQILLVRSMTSIFSWRNNGSYSTSLLNHEQRLLPIISIIDRSFKEHGYWNYLMVRIRWQSWWQSL